MQTFLFLSRCSFTLIESDKKISVLEKLDTATAGQSSYDDTNVSNKIKNNTVSVVNDRRSITWRAAKKSSVTVKEIKRSVEAYMGLPASEYSVLTSDSIKRVDDTNFMGTNYIY